MWTNLLLIGTGLAVVVLVGVVIVEHTRTGRETTRLVDDLLGAVDGETGPVVGPADSADVPAPVQRYLARVLPEGQRRVEAVRIEQSGTFRDADPGAGWSPFTATQHVTTRPPGFVWDASIEVVPWIPVRVLDAYHAGRGRLWARLGGVLTVMAPASSASLDEGELMRYLAEAPLYPTALLPETGVKWSPIDDRSARAVLTDGETTATLTFHFNERNEVERVTGSRGFMTDEGPTESRPWIGYWRGYAERNGMWVPTEGEVAWGLPSGREVSYWRGHIDNLDYRVGKDDDRKRPPTRSW